MPQWCLNVYLSSDWDESGLVCFSFHCANFTICGGPRATTPFANTERRNLVRNPQHIVVPFASRVIWGAFEVCSLPRENKMKERETKRVMREREDCMMGSHTVKIYHVLYVWKPLLHSLRLNGSWVCHESVKAKVRGQCVSVFFIFVRSGRK